MNQTTDYLTVSTAGRELVDITGKVYAWLDRHDATTGLLTVADRDLGRGAQYESCDDHAVTTAVADVNKKKRERSPSPRRQGRRRPLLCNPRVRPRCPRRRPHPVNRVLRP